MRDVCGTCGHYAELHRRTGADGDRNGCTAVKCRCRKFVPMNINVFVNLPVPIPGVGRIVHIRHEGHDDDRCKPAIVVECNDVLVMTGTSFEPMALVCQSVAHASERDPERRSHGTGAVWHWPDGSKESNGQPSFCKRR